MALVRRERRTIVLRGVSGGRVGSEESGCFCCW